MNKTEHYEMNMPGMYDPADITVVSSNFPVIDAEMHKHDESIGSYDVQAKGTIKDRLDGHDQRLDGHDSDIAGIENSLNNHAQRLDGHDSDIDTLESDSGVLKTDVAALKTGKANVGTVTAIGNRVTSLEDQVGDASSPAAGTIEKRLEDVEADIGNYDISSGGTIEQRLNDHDSDIDMLEGAVGMPYPTTEKGSVKNRLSAIEENYVQKDDYASYADRGVVKSVRYYGLQFANFQTNPGALLLADATEAGIKGRVKRGNEGYGALTPSNIQYLPEALNLTRCQTQTYAPGVDDYGNPGDMWIYTREEFDSESQTTTCYASVFLFVGEINGESWWILIKEDARDLM